VATVLAARRAGSVLAVDASPSPHGLLPLLGAPASGTVPTGTTAAEVRAGLARAPGGCYALDLRPAPDWATAVGPIARFFDVVVTDWGLRPAYDLEPVLAGSHAVCLVVRAPEHATDLLQALRTRPGTPPIVVGSGSDHPLRLAAELMRPTGGDRRDR
jgi:hypothetical protein